MLTVAVKNNIPTADLQNKERLHIMMQYNEELQSHFSKNSLYQIKKEKRLAHNHAQSDSDQMEKVATLQYINL